MTSSMNIDKKGIDFIVDEETGGQKYYEKVYKSTFIWPKGASGCTAMVGIDIGYYTASEIDAFFKPLTTSEELERIQGGRGKKGVIAETYLKNLKNITFTWQEALDTFEHNILPKFENYTLKAFPGVEHLASAAQTALVSLVFNRGMAMKGASRSEMRAIRDLVPDKNYKEIARQIVSMKRLWSKGCGLLGRRDREAALVKSCI